MTSVMIDIVTLLHEQVSPQVLQATRSYEGSDDEKQQVLTTLYTLLAARMSDAEAAKRIELLAKMDNADSLLSAGIYESAAPAEFPANLYEIIATNHKVPVATVAALAAAAVPKAYQQIKKAAGVMPTFDYLAQEKATLASNVPAWLIAALPAGLFAATLANPRVNQPAHVETTGTLYKTEKPSGSLLKTLLPIVVGALIFAGAFLLFKSCNNSPTTPVVESQLATTESAALGDVVVSPATFALSLDETGAAVYSCQGDVGNTSLANTLSGHVADAFSTHNCHFQTDAIYADDMPAKPYLPQILELMKGVPDASVEITGHSIVLNSSDAAQAEQLVADIIELLPSEFVVIKEPDLDESTAIAESITAAQTALDGLTTNPTLNELVHALNLQVINFAVDSAEIPDENKAILDSAAAHLQQLPDAHLAITGHTDNQGSLEYNQQLSERRAAAVHDYLVEAGVTDDKLDTSGASYTHPIATNSTPQGRFKNRRIEFTITHQGEMIDTVGNADALADTLEATVDAAARAAQDAADAIQQATTN